MKINADLTEEEVDTLHELLLLEILKHSTEAYIKFHTKEISVDQYKWHSKHADYLKGIKNKLFGDF